MKKLLCMLLAVIMLISLFPASALAEDEGIYDLTAEEPAVQEPTDEATEKVMEEAPVIPLSEEIPVTEAEEAPLMTLDDVIIPEAEPEELTGETPDGELSEKAEEEIEENTEETKEERDSDGAALFAVTLVQGENGEISCAVAEAAEGDTVVLTVTPADGHVVTLVTVNGEELFADEESGEYSFVMPAEAVEITAEFAEEKAEKAEKLLKADNAAVSYKYFDYIEAGNPASGITPAKTGTVTDYKTITNDTKTLENGWYVAAGNVTTDTLVVKGSVGLILSDGSKLNCAGILVDKGNDLTVFAQSDGSKTGVLTAAGKRGCAGIGGSKSHENGPITINGGIITATAYKSGQFVGSAGIGGGYFAKGSNIIINGGNVTAVGSEGAAGIGGGNSSSGVSITVNGGTVRATGGTGEYIYGRISAEWYNYGGAGIGGGADHEGSDIIITGGTVIATGGSCAAGIGGGRKGEGLRISIGNPHGNGSNINVTAVSAENTGAAANGQGGSGIGGGYDAAGTDITIFGGTVEARGRNDGSGIGGGFNRNGEKINIIGGTVKAFGGASGGAGIGGGKSGNGKFITITNANVTAVGGNDGGAGIGGGKRTEENSGGFGENISILSSTVNATGGSGAAGIGGGRGLAWNEGGEIGGNGTDITINASNVTAKGNGDKGGAGIGGGYYGDGKNINITGSRVKATGGGEDYSQPEEGNKGAAGIGGGYHGAGLNITVSGSDIEAHGTGSAAGIGGSYYKNGESIKIISGTVKAYAGIEGGAGIGGGECGNGKWITIGAENAPSDELHLTAVGSPGRGGAGIGGGRHTTVGGGGGGTDITIYSGVVNAIGKGGGAGIGGGPGDATSQKGGNAQNIKIFGGVVTATGGSSGGAGIGGGYYGHGSNITITGGTVDAKGGNFGGAGIGGGYSGYGSEITIGSANGDINSVNVTAKGGFHGGAGIGGGKSTGKSGGDGGSINIYSGTVTATGGNNSAGIGGGNSGTGKYINITGGKVTAKGTGEGAGIGGGWNRNGENITITGGTVDASGGSSGGAGIGGGLSGHGQHITIGTKGGSDNFSVSAQGGSGGAGIGGGKYTKEYKGGGGNDITVNCGTVKATGGNSAAGIGTGSAIGNKNSVGSKGIYINGGNITAQGGPGNGGAGIGGGYYGSVTEVVIEGGTVTAKGDGWGAGIGGCIENGQNIYIYGGTVNAYGGYNGGAGIGGGEGGNGEHITIGDLKKGGENLSVIAEGGKAGGAGIGGGKHSPDNGGGGGRYIRINCGTVKATAGANGGSGIGCGKDDAACHDIFFNSDLAVRAGKDPSSVKVMSHTTDQDIAKPIHSLRYVEALSNEWKYIVTTTNTKDDTIEATRASGTAGISDTKVTVYYDENAKCAKLTSATLIGMPVPAIKYVGVSPTEYAESEAVPTAPGKYKASITVENATAYVTFIIFETKTYLDPTYKVPDDPTSGVAGWNVREVKKYSLINADSETLHSSTYDGWYVVKGNVTADTLKVTGNVKLLLTDGSMLTCNTITVNGKNSLSVYAQSEGDSAGELVVLGKEHCAGIGTGRFDTDMRITFNGGTVTARGSDGFPGIGGFNITINAGTVNASGGFNAAGIGGAVGGSAGNITVNGGTVNAKGGENGAGIGGGSEGRGSNIVFNGGKVTSVGGRLGAGIGGGYMARGMDISINGGNIIAYAGESASGIGGGSRFTGKNIHVGTNVALIAGDSAQTAETVIHKTRQDLSFILQGQRYVEAGRPAAWTYSVVTTNTPDDTIIAVSQSGTGGYTDTRLTIYFDNTSLTAKLNSETFVGKPAPAIKYVGVAPTEYAESETVPTLPGKYEASVTVENAKAHVFFSLGGAASITSGGVTTNYSTIQAAVNAAKANETVVVLSDAQENIVTRRDLVIDLNGFVLSVTDSGSVIRVNGGTLTLKDSNPEKVNDVGGSTVSGAVITGGTNGGVYIQSGSLVMYGGSIYGNSAERSGGGVFVGSRGYFTMHGGTVSGTDASNQSGGVYISYGGSFTMDGGAVSGNNCVGVYNRGSFYMSGDARISGNVGGVYQKGSMYVSGSVNITGNRSGGTTVNLYLDNKLVNIAKAGLSGEAKIGVSSDSDFYIISVTGKNSKDYSSYFTSDNSELHIVNSKNNVVQLVKTTKAAPAKSKK